jgi:hypothetical protein
MGTKDEASTVNRCIGILRNGIRLTNQTRALHLTHLQAQKAQRQGSTAVNKPGNPLTIPPPQNMCIMLLVFGYRCNSSN